MKTLRINDTTCDISSIGANENLLSLLRRNGWTGAKCGCAEGDCGACSVLLIDPSDKPRSINSCLALVPSLEGCHILTAEGLATDGILHPVQQSMVDCQGSQCGYCTPGFIASMAEAYHTTPIPDRTAIADQLCGNLCRCTGYRAIREAMLKALESRPQDSPPLSIPQCTKTRSTNPSLPENPGLYLRPESLEELLKLRELHPQAPLIAGATEIAVLINKRHLRYPVMIGLEKVGELKVIHQTESEWIIGAAAILTDVASALGGEIPAFDRMLSWFASRQIRHRATLGGNLATASPIGDSAPLLLALDAELELISSTTNRRVKLNDFFTGYRRTVLRNDEVIRSIIIPRGLPGRVEFYKVSKRREMDISIVSAAIRVVIGTDGLVSDARIAYGGVAATPMRAKAAELALIGQSPAASHILLDTLDQTFTPLSDHRSSATYRRTLIRGLMLKYFANEPDPTDPFVDSDFLENDAIPHESANRHVTGSALYTEDRALRHNTLHAWPLRSNITCGRMVLLDTSQARNMPGVRDILTISEIPGINNVGPVRHDEPLFADGEIHFRGQLIAMIIGDSLEECRLAAEKIRIEIEETKPILGIQEAISTGSFHTEPHILDRGEVDAALACSDKLLEGSFDIPGQEHFYLETHAAMAEPDGEGGIRIVSSTQHPSEVQAIVAEVMGLSRHEVVVESPRMGGGFGGKETQGNAWAAACALAAIRTGRAVSIQLDRDVDMESTGKRHPFHAKFRVGYNSHGRILAAAIDLVSDGGWALDLSQPVTDRALFHLDNAYHIPAARFTGRVARTNTTSHTAFRGFGGPQGMLVIEEIIGRIALRLGLPPHEVRRTNFYQPDGDANITHYGTSVGEPRIHRIWNELLETSGFDSRRLEIDSWNRLNPNRKRGLAITPVKFGISFTLKHYNQAGALVLVYQDGTVQVNHGGTEMGQGLHTKILGVTMRELGLHRERIRLMHTRTDKVPNTSATAASSGSDLNGMAVADACRQLRDRLTPLAAELLEANPADVIFSNGSATASGRSIDFGKLAATAYSRRIQLSATGFYATPDLDWDWNIRKGRPFYYYAWGAAVSEVEIDVHTGMMHMRRVDILHDVGNSLNPAIDRGQIEGGFVQGMGWLTSEDLRWDEQGKLLTHSASTYAIPAFSDAPVDFRVRLLDHAGQEGTIHGSKAVGEPPFMLAISVREAIRDAISSIHPGDFTLPTPCTGEAIGTCVMHR
jgi:xanthine dehydrogenase molybdopterin binding subunit/xanthine dehydrogenase small subunit